jgi:mono/diheme cytochrome c family protein
VFDSLGITALVAVAVVATLLATRARRANRRVVKWVGLAFSSLLALACTLVIGVALVGFYKINFPRDRPTVADMKVAGTPDQVARGAKFGAFCALCHSPNDDIPLVGRNFSEGGPPVGTVYAANLTPAGEIKDWSDDEVIRAIREGVHKSGRALIIMPSEVFHNLSDADVQAIVAYLRSQPAAGSRTPATKLNVVGALLIGAGLPPTSAQAPIAQPVLAPPAGASAGYGEYLVSILGCRLCHGENLAGRKSGGPGPPGGPNLTLLLPRWSVEDFIHTLRTGVDPYGHTLAQGMPWKQFSSFASDEDLKAIYAFLHGLTPMEGPPK